MIGLGLLALLLSGDMNRAGTINYSLIKGAEKTGKFLGTMVNKLDEEKEEIYAKPLKPQKEHKTKADILYDLGGRFAVDEAHNREKIELEDFPDRYFGR